MPVLKEYAESYEKDGYYVHAPVSECDHPIPLQTPDATKKIYHELGYKPDRPGPDGGVDVPNELTWKLYEVGLHWTENTGPQGDPSDLDLSELRDDTGPELTEEDAKTIISFAENYQGSHQSKVKALRNEFEEEPVEPVFNDRVEELLDGWEPKNLADDSELDRSSGFRISRSEHRDRLAAVSNLEKRLEELANHSWGVESVKADSSGGFEASFETGKVMGMTGWSITDYRGVEGELDFNVCADVRSRSYQVEIVDGYIRDFETGVDHRRLEKFDLPPESNWVYEVEELNRDEIMHAVVVGFAYFVPILGRFFDGFDSYTLESTRVGNHSVQLP